MQTEILRNMRQSFTQMKGPVPELMELNMKTLNTLSFIKPQEWSNLKNPQDMFDKSVEVFVNNGHKMLDYFEKATKILERNWRTSSDQAMRNFKQGALQSKAAVNKTIRKATASSRKLKGR